MIKSIMYKYFALLEKRAVLILGFLMSFPIVLVAMNSMPTRLPFDDIVYLCLIVWLVLSLIKPIKNYISRIFLIVQILWFFSLASFFTGFYRNGLESLLPGATGWASFIYNHLFGDFYSYIILWSRNYLFHIDQSFFNLYYYVFIVAIISAIMITIMGMLESRFNWKWFLVIGLYFLVAWFLYVEYLRFAFSLYFIGVTVYKQFGVYESVIEEAKGKGERTRYYNYSSAMFIGGIIMASLLVVSSVASHYIPVERINLKIDKFVPDIGGLRSDYVKGTKGNTFSFSKTMYAPNGVLLGGPILERDYSVVMRVKSKVGGQYLRGKVKNIYDGKSWNSDFGQYRNNQFVGDLYTPLPSEQIVEMAIYPDRINTTTIFSPYLYYISEYDRSEVFGNTDHVVYVKNDLDLSYQNYDVWYVKPEYIGLYDFLNDEDRPLYLKLPKKGIDKTTALANEITQDLTDPREKITALVDYLRENYRYTLNTQEFDYEMDFVEHFLFEEGMGYCTYFATSLAIMGRVADVPTRYVEGYIVNDYTNSDGLYEVTANRAHAWVEAYIEGEGWVTFEATPAYSVNTTPEDKPEEEYTLYNDVNLDDFALDISDQPVEQPEMPVSEVTQETFNTEIVATILIYSGLFLLLIFIVYKKKKRIKDDIELGNATERVNKRIRYMLSMASHVDADYDLTELPKHVLIRICDRYLQLLIPRQIIKMIDQSLYSLYEFSEEEFAYFEEFFDAFEERAKSRIGTLGYGAHKYIFNTLYHKDYYQ